ncbi:hypothetical protein KAR91_68385 [Candidatus Pacearchaeota archaeon]|nr:hypothetical protein [Candidatus Pacearchaeota archaeon]
MGLLAKYYGGGLSILDQKKMYWYEVLKWYDIYELQSIEEEVIEELRYDNKGNRRSLPKSKVIREIVNEKIEERKKEREQELNGSEEQIQY